MKKSLLEKKFLFLLKTSHIEKPVEEYRFDANRKWRFDFAWVIEKVAVEIEGGIWSAGRHVRGSGFIADCDKYNSAALDGWIVFRFTSKHLDDPKAVCNAIQLALNQRSGYDIERCPECGETIKVMRSK
ncbi:MAG: hypothetical protein ACE5H1_09320 [Thermodesulfobacteriota bacterium]